MTRTDATGRHRLQGWEAPVAVPHDLTSLTGPTTGFVHLPARIYSSGAADSRRFHLDNEAERIELYEIVLTDGGTGDAAEYLNLDELRRLWPKLTLSPHVRRAWAPRLPELLGS